MIASCKNVSSVDGLLTAVQNLVNSANPPAIISISYGGCEAFNTAASNAAYNTIYQQGVAEGVSFFVSSGDEDAGGCDVNFNGLSTFTVTHGIAVNALASSPYVVAVGGTDFSDTYSGTKFDLLERGQLGVVRFGQVLHPGDSVERLLCQRADRDDRLGYATVTYGSTRLLQQRRRTKISSTTPEEAAGPAAARPAAPSIAGVVSGTCAGYAKPSWQSVLGNPE